jgi:alpha-tubulin suppressor-like RCC1 family protein
MSGAIYCWGYNGLGQLGDGTQADRGSPVSVTGPAMSTISAGSAVSCATATGGVSYCWGEDNFEQLGNGNGENPCMIKEFRHRCSTTPVAVQPAISFGVLAPGFVHVCALTPVGAAWCWGDNTLGQLGTGSASSATAMAVAHPQPFEDIDTGQFHTCAITSTYAVQCWGENSSGQLGDGTASRRHTPTSIAGGTLPQG